jgi:hypothetical protein
MTGIAETLAALHATGTAINVEFERAAFTAGVSAAGMRQQATKRGQAWHVDLRAAIALLGPTTVALFEKVGIPPESARVSFIKQGNAIAYDPLAASVSAFSFNSTDPQVHLRGSDWAIAWQCHRVWLLRLQTVMERMPADKTDLKIAVPRAVKLYLKANGHPDKAGYRKTKLFDAVAAELECDEKTVRNYVDDLGLLG